MAGYVTNIEGQSLSNDYFRRVLFTDSNSQLVLMSLKPGEEIGMETHDGVDQFFRIESGRGAAFLDSRKYNLVDGTAVVVPAGTQHNIVNTSRSEPLKMYTIYSPPQHPDGTIHKTKAEAIKAEANVRLQPH